jgi:hypothetical protein
MPVGSMDSNALPASVSKTCLVRFNNSKNFVMPVRSDVPSRFSPCGPHRHPPGRANRH